jgi:hypothetical protein
MPTATKNIIDSVPASARPSVLQAQQTHLDERRVKHVTKLLKVVFILFFLLY